MIGLSLTMNSAKRLTKNRNRKIHKLQKPRLLAWNKDNRRRVRGDRVMRFYCLPNPHPGLLPGREKGFVRALCCCFSSHVPLLEIDARVDGDVSQIADQVEHQPKQGEHVERAEHYRVVAVDHRLITEQAQAVERKD